MYSALYTAIIFILIHVLAFFNFIGFVPEKVKRFFLERRHAQLPQKGKTIYWIHASSLGEYEMALPIIRELIKNGINKGDLLITFFSSSGYKQAVKGEYAERIMYLPLDNKSSVKQFYKDYSPEKALFIRYDLWYNLILEGIKNQTQFYLVNARFTENHFIFNWYGNPYAKLLWSFNRIFCSDQNSHKLLLSKEFTNTSYTGDTRFDRVSQIAAEAKTYNSISTFKGFRKLMLLGSSWQEEEELLAKLVGKVPSGLCYIIAPHDISRSLEISEKFNQYQPKLYTEDIFAAEDSILILDTIGMLSSVYQYADFAFIGGGFRGALHNILEPAIWGCHISFGPKVEKFPEASDIVNAGFALSVSNESDWIQEIIQLSEENDRLDQIKKTATSFVSENMGVVQKMMPEITQS